MGNKAKCLTLVAFLWITRKKTMGNGNMTEGLPSDDKKMFFCGKCGEKKVNNSVIRDKTKRSFA